MEKDIVKSGICNQIDEAKECLHELAVVIDCAVLAEADAEDLANVACLARREIKHVIRMLCDAADGLNNLDSDFLAVKIVRNTE